MKNIKNVNAFICVIAAIGFGIAGTVIAPMGIIDSSMLYLVAQLLIYSATILGFGDAIRKIAELMNQKKGCEKD